MAVKKSRGNHNLPQRELKNPPPKKEKNFSQGCKKEGFGAPNHPWLSGLCNAPTRGAQQFFPRGRVGPTTSRWQPNPVGGCSLHTRGDSPLSLEDPSAGPGAPPTNPPPLWRGVRRAKCYWTPHTPPPLVSGGSVLSPPHRPAPNRTGVTERLIYGRAAHMKLLPPGKALPNNHLFFF